MRVNPADSGDPFFQKHLQRYNAPGYARELTFSCFRGYAFLGSDRTRQWFVDALRDALKSWEIALWAYVIMPNHVHLLVMPPRDNIEQRITRFLQDLKAPVARQAIALLEKDNSPWLKTITVREGKRTRRRFWQPGGGYDRNIDEPATLRSSIDYLHDNPLRRKLVERSTDWIWSSARWYAGIRPVPIEIDSSVLREMDRD